MGAPLGSGEATQSVETGALFHTLVGRTSRNQTTAVNINMCGVLRIEEVLGESGRKAPLSRTSRAVGQGEPFLEKVIFKLRPEGPVGST